MVLLHEIYTKEKCCKVLKHFIGSSISSTESDASISIGKAWAAIDRFSTIRKFDFSAQIKQWFFQAVVVSELLFSCTAWTRWALHKNAEEYSKIWLARSPRGVKTKKLDCGSNRAITFTLRLIPLGNVWNLILLAIG